MTCYVEDLENEFGVVKSVKLTADDGDELFRMAIRLNRHPREIQNLGEPDMWCPIPKGMKKTAIALGAIDKDETSTR